MYVNEHVNVKEQKKEVWGMMKRTCLLQRWQY